MKHHRAWDTRASRSPKRKVRVFVVAVAAVFALTMILVILYNVSVTEEIDSAEIAVSAKNTAGFPQGAQHFPRDTRSLYIYVRSVEGQAELSVERRGLTSVVSALGGEEGLMIGDGSASGEATRFELTESSGGRLPPGRYTVRLLEKGEVETFSVRRW